MAKSKKRKKKIEGLGDAVHAVTSALGIDKLVKTTFDAAGLDCGCDERRKRWNEKFPFRKKPYDCLTENEYNKLHEVFTERGSVITMEMQKVLRRISDRIHREKTEMSGCGSCIRNLYEKMKLIYQEYKDEKDSADPNIETTS